MWHNTIWYNTRQHDTIQYNTIQYNTIQYNTIQYNTMQYNTIKYNTIQYDTIQFNKIQYDVTKRIEAAVDNIATQKQSIADTSLLYSVNHEIRYYWMRHVGTYHIYTTFHCENTMKAYDIFMILKLRQDVHFILYTPDLWYA